MLLPRLECLGAMIDFLGVVMEVNNHAVAIHSSLISGNVAYAILKQAVLLQ